MFNLTGQERQVILFLMCMALIGLGVNFALKVNSRIERFIRIDDIMTKIDINQASYRDLLDIKGISPRLAKNIIEYRRQHGPFKDLEELKEVNGIGEFRYNKIKEYLALE